MCGIISTNYEGTLRVRHRIAKYPFKNRVTSPFTGQYLIIQAPLASDRLVRGKGNDKAYQSPVSSIISRIDKLGE